ncbi:hypothetical protein BJX62DRAFT_232577 [Aspergillus germanicus]
MNAFRNMRLFRKICKVSHPPNIVYSSDLSSPRGTKRKRKATPSVAKTKKRKYGPKDHRIRVSSAQLIKSSPFFKGTLTSIWKESARFQEDKEMQIGMPDWDIDALLAVMRLLHNKPRKLPKKPSFKLLAGVCIIADYYQRQDTILACRKWRKNNLVASVPFWSDVGTMVIALWVARLFGYSLDFSIISRNLLLRSHGTLDSGGLLIPQGILDEICDRRRRMLDGFITTTWDYKATLNDPPDMEVLNRFILDNNLVHAALPLPELTILGLKEKFSALNLPDRGSGLASNLRSRGST